MMTETSSINVYYQICHTKQQTEHMWKTYILKITQGELIKFLQGSIDRKIVFNAFFFLIKNKVTSSKKNK